MQQDKSTSAALTECANSSIHTMIQTPQIIDITEVA